MKQPTWYYVYMLVDPRDWKARYVGKSADPGERVKSHLSSRRRHTSIKGWLLELVELGVDPQLVILGRYHKMDDVAEYAWMKILMDCGHPIQNKRKRCPQYPDSRGFRIQTPIDRYNLKCWPESVYPWIIHEYSWHRKQLARGKHYFSIPGKNVLVGSGEYIAYMETLEAEKNGYGVF